MGSKKLEEILGCAAETPEFRDKLLNNREDTVAQLDLSDAEKSVLLSVSREQLEKMIDETKRIHSRWSFPFSTGTKIAVGLGAVVLTAGLLQSAGISPDRSHERIARRALEQVVLAENLYREAYGTYGSMENLLKDSKTKEVMEGIFLSPKIYELTITTDGETFTAVASRKKGDKVKESFKAGPDGIYKIKTE